MSTLRFLTSCRLASARTVGTALAARPRLPAPLMRQRVRINGTLWFYRGRRVAFIPSIPLFLLFFQQEVRREIAAGETPRLRKGETSSESHQRCISWIIAFILHSISIRFYSLLVYRAIPLCTKHRGREAFDVGHTSDKCLLNTVDLYRRCIVLYAFVCARQRTVEYPDRIGRASSPRRTEQSMR